MTINIKDLIKPASESSSWLKICIYGEAGCGKTTLAAYAPKPLFVDTERGTTALVKNEQLRDIPVIERRSLAEMLELIAMLKTKDGDEYDTIIIDTVSELSSLFLDTVIQGTRSDGFAVPEGGYEKRNQQGRRLLSDLIDLPKHIIMLSHVGNIQVNSITCKAPALSAKLVQSVVGFMDIVGYMYTVNEPAPTQANPTATEKVRYIQTAGTATVTAKNRLSVPDVMKNPTIQDFLNDHNKNKTQKPITTFKG